MFERLLVVSENRLKRGDNEYLSSLNVYVNELQELVTELLNEVKMPALNEIALKIRDLHSEIEQIHSASERSAPSDEFKNKMNAVFKQIHSIKNMFSKNILKMLEEENYKLKEAETTLLDIKAIKHVVELFKLGAKYNANTTLTAVLAIQQQFSEAYSLSKGILIAKKPSLELHERFRTAADKIVPYLNSSDSGKNILTRNNKNDAATLKKYIEEKFSSTESLIVNYNTIYNRISRLKEIKSAIDDHMSILSLNWVKLSNVHDQFVSRAMLNEKASDKTNPHYVAAKSLTKLLDNQLQFPPVLEQNITQLIQQQIQLSDQANSYPDGSPKIFRTNSDLSLEKAAVSLRKTIGFIEGSQVRLINDVMNLNFLDKLNQSPKAARKEINLSVAERNKNINNWLKSANNVIEGVKGVSVQLQFNSMEIPKRNSFSDLPSPSSPSRSSVSTSFVRSVSLLFSPSSRSKSVSTSTSSKSSFFSTFFKSKSSTDIAAMDNAVDEAKSPKAETIKEESKSNSNSSGDNTARSDADHLPGMVNRNKS